MNIRYAEQVCSILDELGLPRAFVQSQLDRFVAWNSHFLNALKIPENEIKALVASEVLCFEDGVEFDDGLRMIPCSAHPSAGSKSPVSGHVITNPGGLNFVMLDVGAPAEQVFESSLAAAIQEVRNRLYRFLHDRMNPNLLAVAFSAESLAAKLKTQPEAAKEAEKIRWLLRRVFDEMHLLFAPPLLPTKSEMAPGAPEEKRPDA